MNAHWWHLAAAIAVMLSTGMVLAVLFEALDRCRVAAARGVRAGEVRAEQAGD